MRFVIVTALSVLLAAAGAASAADRLDRDDCRRADPGRSIASCTRLIEDGATAKQERAMAYYNRGRAHFKNGNLDRAASDLTEVIRLSPRHSLSFNMRGYVFLRGGDFDRAIADFTEAIRIDPRYSLAFNNRGAAFRQRGDFARAIADYDEAIRLDPKNAFAFDGRGITQFQRQNYESAIADLSEAIRLEPKFITAYANRGLAWEIKGERERARADYGRALADVAEDDQSRSYQQIARERLAALSKEAERDRRPQSVPAPAPSFVPNWPPRGRRVALVIGNGAYGGGARLENPRNDADDVSAALRRLGFDVTEGKDVTLETFSQLIDAFRKQAAGAEAALFYYAGHAMQFESHNWLMPIDTRFATRFEARHFNVDLGDVVSELEKQAATTLIFLDACRDNPLARRFEEGLSADRRGVVEARGLARPDVKSPQTLVVFATRPDTTAEDGRGRNSPFTTAFLKHVATPGVEIEVLMKRVTASVALQTNGKQQPERVSRLEQEFYFVSAP